MIPGSPESIKEIQSPARYILVIEKDATFQKLLEKNFHLTYGPCILVTVSLFERLGNLTNDIKTEV